jgi:hypothetical protein
LCTRESGCESGPCLSAGFDQTWRFSEVASRRRVQLDRETKSVRTVLYGLVFFSLIGISLATETLSRLGLADNYAFIVTLGFIFSLLLVGKKPLLVLCVLLGVLAINLPESFMENYRIDRDILIASVCSFILVPTLYDLFLA